MTTRHIFSSGLLFLAVGVILLACALRVQTSPHLFYAATAFFAIATVHLARTSLRLRANRKPR